MLHVRVGLCYAQILQLTVNGFAAESGIFAIPNRAPSDKPAFLFFFSLLLPGLEIGRLKGGGGEVFPWPFWWQNLRVGIANL